MGGGAGWLVKEGVKGGLGGSVGGDEDVGRSKIGVGLLKTP